MTTEELIKQLNANGWTNSSLITEEKSQDYISICAPFNDEVMEVPVDATNWLNVKLDYFEARDGLTGAVREYVSSLVTQYLNTPISERKPGKKYRLVAVRLMVLAIALTMLGGACWIAFTIWRSVFGFFM